MGLYPFILGQQFIYARMLLDRYGVVLTPFYFNIWSDTAQVTVFEAEVWYDRKFDSVLAVMVMVFK